MGARIWISTATVKSNDPNGARHGASKKETGSVIPLISSYPHIPSSYTNFKYVWIGLVLPYFLAR